MAPSPADMFPQSGGMLEMFQKEFDEAYSAIGRFNLAIFGKTGSGKSTLINAIFGQDIAPTGIGKPITKGLNYYVHSNGFLGIYDSEGFETGTSGNAILAGLNRLVAHKNVEPIDQRIHAAWYVVRWSDRRFETSQADFIRALRALGLPVLIVITQVPSRNNDGQISIHPDATEFAHYIESLGLGTDLDGVVYLTNARHDPFTNADIFGLTELIAATSSVIPAAAENALIAAQQVDVKRKKDAAAVVIKQAALISSGIGAVPIPIADAALLVPNQVAMIARITAIYGLPRSRSRAISIAGAAILTGGATQVGRYAVTQLLRFVPGGQIAGSAISASVAAALTRAIGVAWSRVCEYALTLTPSEQEKFLEAKVRDQFVDYMRIGEEIPPA
jgi:uncharacterized protein (DUF697 family)/GTP-binding protein EngB required for normal cell division